MKRKKIALIGSILIFCLLFIDAFSIYAMQNLDQSILELMSSLWSDSLNSNMTLITHLSGEFAVILFSISVVATLTVLKKWDDLFFSMMSLFGSLFLFSFFKSIVARDRPPTKFFDPGEYSFPSGHAAMSMCMGLLLYLLLKPRLNQGKQNILLLNCLMFPVAISFTRVYLHVHYLSDVIGGMALSLAWVLLLSYIYLPNELSKTKQV